MERVELDDKNLIAIASRPAMGKTTLLLNLAMEKALKDNTAVAVFSLELSVKECVSIILSNQIKRETDNQFIEAVKQLLEAKLFIDDKTFLIEEMKAKCIKLKKEKDISLVVIDYFQLIATHQKYYDREQELSYIGSQLKELAQELNTPVVIAVQMPIVRENKENKPTLEDIQFTGSLIQDADSVLILGNIRNYV